MMFNHLPAMKTFHHQHEKFDLKSRNSCLSKENLPFVLYPLLFRIALMDDVVLIFLFSLHYLKTFLLTSVRLKSLVFKRSNILKLKYTIF